MAGARGSRGRQRNAVLLLGASGLIGSAVAARLAMDGVPVVAVVRGHGPAVRRLPAARLLRADLRRMTDPEDWREALSACGR